ncbi:MAG: S8 family peptidase, partial [Flavobacteriales bacterium]|nr:S8 family peptidase [Flavobacteriales bacterium]
MNRVSILSVLVLTAVFSFAQEDKKLIGWHQKDASEDNVHGVSAEKALVLLKDRKPKRVVVAIIDSGVDIDHEDLKDNIWVNENEVAGNGIDDDENGYVDDVHGWNFLGNASGTNLDHANLEVTRIYRKLAPRFQEVASAKDVEKSARDDYALFIKVKEKILEELNDAAAEFAQIDGFITVFNSADSTAKVDLKEEYSMEDVLDWEPTDEECLFYKSILIGVMQDASFSKKELIKYHEHLQDKLEYHYNPRFVDRSFLGDDPDNITDRFYGNNDVSAPHNDHGTHVAGIVGAVRGNGIGMDGICPNAELMILRAVPNGDEFDKDIANAIRYAADNGAAIINMSFGKGYSPQVGAVHEAIRYAEKKDVLMIHAAGNDAENIDEAPNFPNPYYTFQKLPCSTWLTVGASSSTGNENLAGVFSNYGKKKVDVFAPGVEIYSAKPDNTYEFADGTSMAAPVTSGVAALIRSYFPQMTAIQVKDILLSSTS